MFYVDVEPEVDVERSAFFNVVEDYQSFGSTWTSPPFKYSKPGGTSTEDYRKNISALFRNEPCLYNHRNFQFAGMIFNVMKHSVEDYKRRPRNRKRPEVTLSYISETGTKVATKAGEQKLPVIEFNSESEKRLSYSLVYQTLKCEYFKLYFPKFRSEIN